jgi:hypothetical protein
MQHRIADVGKGSKTLKVSISLQHIVEIWLVIPLNDPDNCPSMDNEFDPANALAVATRLS